MCFARIAAYCLLCAALSACAAHRRAADENAGGPVLEDLAGRVYYLVSMDGRSFEGGNAPELGFTREGRVVGRACNRFSGAAKIANGTLTAKNAAATRMACFQPFLNELEQLVFGMLENGARINLDGSRLTLARDGHALVYALPSPKP
jgi:heat shock protein HslJ